MSRRETVQEPSPATPADRAVSGRRRRERQEEPAPASRSPAAADPSSQVPAEAARRAAGGAFLSFQVADQRYGLPVTCVRQIIEMVAFTPLPGAPEMVAGVIDFHGRVIPLLDMRSRFLQPPQPYTLRTPIVIAQLDEYLVGLAVDAVTGVVEIPPQQLEDPETILSRELAPQPLYLAAVVPRPEGPFLVLNPSAVLPRPEKKALANALAHRAVTTETGTK